jgi:hypothetical protein
MSAVMFVPIFLHRFNPLPLRFWGHVNLREHMLTGVVFSSVCVHQKFKNLQSPFMHSTGTSFEGTARFSLMMRMAFAGGEVATYCTHGL